VRSQRLSHRLHGPALRDVVAIAANSLGGAICPMAMVPRCLGSGGPIAPRRGKEPVDASTETAAQLGGSASGFAHGPVDLVGAREDGVVASTAGETGVAAAVEGAVALAGLEWVGVVGEPVRTVVVGLKASVPGLHAGCVAAVAAARTVPPGVEDGLGGLVVGFLGNGGCSVCGWNGRDVRWDFPVAADGAGGHGCLAACALPDGFSGRRAAVDLAWFSTRGAEETGVDALVRGTGDDGVIIAPRGQHAAWPAFDAQFAEQSGFDEQLEAHETRVMLAEDGGCLEGVDDVFGNEGFQEENHGRGVEC